MSYVALIFRRVFGYGTEIGLKHMLEVHHSGHSIVWVGLHEQAEHYSNLLHQWQLNASIQKMSYINLNIDPSLLPCLIDFVQTVADTLKSQLALSPHLQNDDPEFTAIYLLDLQ